MFTLPKPRAVSPLGHSADVKLWLHLADQTIPLRQTGTDRIKLGSDVHVPPGPAKVEIVVDGRSHISDITVTGRQADGLWLDIVTVQ